MELAIAVNHDELTTFARTNYSILRRKLQMLLQDGHKLLSFPLQHSYKVTTLYGLVIITAGWIAVVGTKIGNAPAANRHSKSNLGWLALAVGSRLTIRKSYSFFEKGSFSKGPTCGM